MNPARVLWGPRRWLFLYAFVVGLDSSCLPQGTLHHYSTSHFNSAGGPGRPNPSLGPSFFHTLCAFLLYPRESCSAAHISTCTSMMTSTFLRNRTGIQSTPSSAISKSKALRGPCCRLSKRPGRLIPTMTMPTSTRKEDD